MIQYKVAVKYEVAVFNTLEEVWLFVGRHMFLPNRRIRDYLTDLLSQGKVANFAYGFTEGSIEVVSGGQVKTA